MELHKPIYRSCIFRFYAELNDFISLDRRFKCSRYFFTGTPSIKDAIEAQQVPHTEVDLILVNGRSVNFCYLLKDGDHIAVYPVFERLDIQPLQHLRSKPLRTTRFIVDVHLGKLARYLRILGFDTLYQNNFPDDVIIDRAIKERRVILTRDLGILKHSHVTHGYWLRSTKPQVQLVEAVKALQLEKQIKPFSRCSLCNGIIVDVSVDQVKKHLPGNVSDEFSELFQCKGCQQIYWKGSHYQRLLAMIEALNISEICADIS